MRYHYSLVPGDEPIIRDMPIYGAANINNGALMMLGQTDPDSDADQGISLVIAYATSSSATCVDTVGILTESTYESTTPNAVYATATNGAYYGKVIINPCAVYLAEYLTDSSNRITSGTSSSTVLYVNGLEDDIDGGWVFFTKDSVAANQEALRFITAAASGLATLDSAPLTTASTSDYIVKILPQNHRITYLDSTSVGLYSLAGTGNSTKLHVAENYINSNAISMQPLRKKQHSGLNYVKGGKLFADIVMLDHMYNNLS